MNRMTKKNIIRQAAIVEMRAKGARFREIGEIVGLSRQRVYQIWKRAMARKNAG